MRRVVLWLVLSAAAVGVGFLFALMVMSVLQAVLPPFRFPEDDDSWRELGPVLAGYGVWATMAVAGSVLAWRCVRSRVE